MKIFWDGVVAISAPRVTAQDASYGEVESLDGSVLLDGFDGVLRAGGCEAAAGRSQWRDESLVEADGKDEEMRHSRFFILR